MTAHEPDVFCAATVELRVSGFVYYECFDPMCTDVPRELGWPEPVTVKMGKGYQMRYEVTGTVAREMLANAFSFGEAMSSGVDDPSIGRRVCRWARRECERLGFPEIVLYS
jgi:hypothetical protein